MAISPSASNVSEQVEETIVNMMKVAQPTPRSCRRRSASLKESCNLTRKPYLPPRRSQITPIPPIPLSPSPVGICLPPPKIHLYHWLQAQAMRSVLPEELYTIQPHPTLQTPLLELRRLATRTTLLATPVPAIHCLQSLAPVQGSTFPRVCRVPRFSLLRGRDRGHGQVVLLRSILRFPRKVCS
ncbi:hypothetical protein BS47DRAFT_15591 [Hydnum rufescens UP504]|uniref:Uncharacterized protein n=1 Tax=Hydnum rufescens UP504 TaxID=1448309 RepID=A0A9P6E2S9_9AGAM|nr:hypothetical protein BS47DRAFT_15591 [Hydnum rufescens UP504]